MTNNDPGWHTTGQGSTFFFLIYPQLDSIKCTFQKFSTQILLIDRESGRAVCSQVPHSPPKPTVSQSILLGFKRDWGRSSVSQEPNQVKSWPYHLPQSVVARQSCLEHRPCCKVSSCTLSSSSCLHFGWLFGFYCLPMPVDCWMLRSTVFCWVVNLWILDIHLQQKRHYQLFP